MPRYSANKINGIPADDAGNVEITLTPSQNLQDTSEFGNVTTLPILSSNLNLGNVPEYENNAAAIAGGLVNGEFYKLPYNNGVHKLAIVQLLPEINFDVTSTNWGASGIVDANSFKTFLETWGGYPDSIDNFSLVDGRLICNVTGWITEFFGSNKFINQVNIINLPGLESLYLNGNQIVIFDPIKALPATLINLMLYYNQIVTFDPTIPLPEYLEALQLDTNQIVTFEPTFDLPQTLNSLQLSGNKMTTNAVNTVLQYWDNATKSSPFNLNLTQSPDSPPSGAGITAKSNLISRGCTIQTD